MHPPPLLGSSRGNMASISIQLVNVTVCNDKALAYFAELALREDQPNVVAVTESHLQGFHLNKVRRQLRTIGWKTFVTPAIAADEESIALDVEEQQKKRYHNSGGELLLCNLASLYGAIIRRTMRRAIVALSTEPKDSPSLWSVPIFFLALGWTKEPIRPDALPLSPSLKKSPWNGL